MKFKVTIELEEGTKETIEHNITSEAIIMFSERGGSFALRDKMVKEAAYSAENAMYRLYNLIASNGFVLQYVHNDRREAVLLSEVNKLDADHKKSALAVMTSNQTKWNLNKIKQRKLLKESE